MSKMNLTLQKMLAILHVLQYRKWGEAKGLKISVCGEFS